MSVMAIVVDALCDVLNQYVVDFRREHVKVGLWEGDVRLQNVRLKPKMLESLNIPFHVHSGKIGEIHLHIPWRMFSQAEILLEIREISLVLERSADAEVISGIDAAIKEAARRAKMRVVERVEAELTGSSRRKSIFGRFAGRVGMPVAMRLIQNLRINIELVHISMIHNHEADPQQEGHAGAPPSSPQEKSEKPADKNYTIIAGLGVERIYIGPPRFEPPEHRRSADVGAVFRSSASLASMNGDDFSYDSDEASEDGAEPCAGSIDKVLRVTGFGVYLREVAQRRNWEYLTFPPPTSPAHVLKPMSMGAEVKLDLPLTNSERTRGSAKVNIEVESLEFVLSDHCMKAIGLLDKGMDLLKRRLRFQEWRPSESPLRSRRVCRAWWSYAINCVRYELGERGRAYTGRFSWEGMLTRSRRRKDYIRLYQRLLLHGPPSEDDGDAAAEGAAEDAASPMNGNGADHMQSPGNGAARAARRRKSPMQRGAPPLSPPPLGKKLKVVSLQEKLTLREFAAVEELQDHFSAQEILLYRSVARRQIERKGMEAPALKELFSKLLFWTQTREESGFAASAHRTVHPLSTKIVESAAKEMLEKLSLTSDGHAAVAYNEEAPIRWCTSLSIEAISVDLLAFDDRLSESLADVCAAHEAARPGRAMPLSPSPRLNKSASIGKILPSDLLRSIRELHELRSERQAAGKRKREVMNHDAIVKVTVRSIELGCWGEGFTGEHLDAAFTVNAIQAATGSAADNQIFLWCGGGRSNLAMDIQMSLRKGETQIQSIPQGSVLPRLQLITRPALGKKRFALELGCKASVGRLHYNLMPVMLPSLVRWRRRVQHYLVRLPPLVEPHPFARLRKLTAARSAAPLLDVRRFAEKGAVNVDATLEGVEVKCALSERDERNRPKAAVVFRLGEVRMLTGSFLKHASRVAKEVDDRRALADALKSPSAAPRPAEDSAIRPQLVDVLFSGGYDAATSMDAPATGAQWSPFMRPVFLRVSDVHFDAHGGAGARGGEDKLLLCQKIEVLSQRCLIAGHPLLPASRLDVAVSPLCISATPKRLLHATAVARELQARLHAAKQATRRARPLPSRSPFATGKGAGALPNGPRLARPPAGAKSRQGRANAGAEGTTGAPRIALIAPLVSARVNVALDELQLRLLRNEERGTVKLHEEAEECISEIASTFIEHGDVTRASFQCAYIIAIEKLAMLGFDRDAVDDAVSRVVEALQAGRDAGADEQDGDNAEAHFNAVWNTFESKWKEGYARLLQTHSNKMAMRGVGTRFRAASAAGEEATAMASPAAAGGAAAELVACDSTFLTLYASDLTLSLSQLTYDRRMKVEVGAMSLCDGCGLRLLRLEPISKDSGDNEEENKPRQRRAGFKERLRKARDRKALLEKVHESAQLSKDTVAFRFEVTDQDRRWGFGVGGEDPTLLARLRFAGSWKQEPRRVHVGFALTKVRATVEPTSLNRLIDGLRAYMEMYYTAEYSSLAHLEKRRAISGAVRAPAAEGAAAKAPAMHNYLSVTGQVTTVAIMLKTETAVFSRLSMRSVILDYILTPIGASGRASTLTKVSVTELHLLDLTQLKHWEVAAKGGSGIPMVRVKQSVVPRGREHKDTTVTVTVANMHLCFLNRFINELLMYIGARGIGPVVARAKEMAAAYSTEQLLRRAGRERLLGLRGRSPERPRSSRPRVHSDGYSSAGSAANSPVDSPELRPRNYTIDTFEHRRGRHSQGSPGAKRKRGAKYRPHSPLMSNGRPLRRGAADGEGGSDVDLGGDAEAAPSAEEGDSFTWRVQLVDCHIFAPRNSKSLDMVCFKVGKGLIAKKEVRESWQMPASQEEADRHAGEAKANGPAPEDPTPASAYSRPTRTRTKPSLARLRGQAAAPASDSEPDEFFDALTSRERFATMTDDEGSVCFFDAEMGAASDEESASSGAEGGSWQDWVRDRAWYDASDSDSLEEGDQTGFQSALDKQGEGAVIFDRFLQGHFFQDSASPQAPAFLQKDLIAQSEHVHIAWAAPAWAEGSAGLGAAAEAVEPGLTGRSAATTSRHYQTARMSQAPQAPQAPQEAGEPAELGERVSRLDVKLEDLEIYCTLTPRAGEGDSEEVEPLSSAAGASVRWGGYMRCPGPVSSGAPVFSGGSSIARELSWALVSGREMRLGCYVDSAGSLSRILLFSPLDADFYLNLSMAELYLLKSVWYDNWQEESHFFPKAPSASHGSAEDAPADGDAPEPWTFDYGSRGWIERLKAVVPAWEFAIAFPQFRIRTAIDTRFFPRVPDSLFMAMPEGGMDPEDPLAPERVPCYDLDFQGFLIRMYGDADAFKMVVAANEWTIVDIREPFRSVIPTCTKIGVSAADVDRAGRRVRRWPRDGSFADLDFGLELTPLDIDKPLSLPVQVTVTTTPDSWLLVNVGLDHADLALRDLAMVWILIDYFASYFSYKEYGQPGFVEYVEPEKPEPGPGGIDVRVWVTRPCIALMENAHIASSMSCLVEASGVYFQWKKESFGPMRMEVVVKSAAIVLRKGFRGCEEDRGIRGAAGSGRGVRTIVDGLDVLYHQSFCPVSLHSNMTVKIPYRPYDLHPDARDPSTGFAEMPLDLPAVVPKGQQTIVQPTVEPNVNIGIEPTLLITSYEDILKIAACILVFLGPYKREPSADEAPASADADADADADAEWPTPSTPEYRGRGLRSEARAMLEREDTGVTAEYSDSESGVEEEKTPGWLEDGSAADEGSDTPSATAHAAGSEDGAAGAEESPEGTSTIIVHIQNLSVCVVDPVLGLHLPVARLMVTSASAVIDRLQDDEYELRSYTQEELSEMALLAEDADQATLQKKLFEIGHDERKALNVCVQLIAYGEYFNNTIRCWEILLEPIEAELLYEVCEARGTGIILRMPSVLHLNATTALLKTLDDAIRIAQEVDVGDHFTQVHEKQYMVVPDYSECDGAAAENGSPAPGMNRMPRLTPERRHAHAHAQQRKRGIDALLSPQIDVPIEHDIATGRGKAGVRAHHCFYDSLAEDDRVAFGINNLCGHRVRFLQLHGHSDSYRLQYVRHKEIAHLHFGAVLMSIRNGQVIEQPFPCEEVAGRGEQDLRSMSSAGVNHDIALQIAGFEWLKSVSAHEFGASYHTLRLTSGQRQLGHIPWPMVNAMKLVTEVKALSGGRQLELRSVFRVVNACDHRVVLTSYPNASYDPAQSMKRSRDRKRQGDAGDDEVPLDPGSIYEVPIALLYAAAQQYLSKNRRVDAGRGLPLGCIWVRPKSGLSFQSAVVDDAQQAKMERNTSDQSSGSTEPVVVAMYGNRKVRTHYCKTPIDLGTIVQDAALAYEEGREKGGPIAEAAPPPHGRSLSCPLTLPQSAVDVDKMRTPLAPITYCVEVRRTPFRHGSAEDFHESQAGMLSRLVRKKGQAQDQSRHAPLEYSLVIHPPIVLENFLPKDALFQLMHGVQDRIVWSSKIKAGERIPIHTVGLEAPLRLLIRIDLAGKRDKNGQVQASEPLESVAPYALIHQGAEARAQTGFNLLIGQTSEHVAKQIVLRDLQGQRLVLGIDNTLGGGGQRHIVVYCPYWMINTTGLNLRYSEEGVSGMPAGTPSLDAGDEGVVDLAAGKAHAGGAGAVISRPDLTPVPSLGPLETPVRPSLDTQQTTPVPLRSGASRPRLGTAGRQLTPTTPAAYAAAATPEEHGDGAAEEAPRAGTFSMKGTPVDEANTLDFLSQDFTPQQLAERAFLFNFNESRGILNRHKKVAICVGDSESSKGFSLDTVGVNQAVSVWHPRMRLIELSFVISLAPGKLGKYSKVVKFFPRFVAVNHLEQPIRLAQKSAFRGMEEVLRLQARSVSPFNMPHLHSERKVIVEMSGAWTPSAALPIDEPGDYDVNMNRRADIISNFTSRGQAEFEVVIPPLGDEKLGLWLETDWDQSIIVQGIRSEMHAGRKTDIRKGDMLLSIDGVACYGKGRISFEEVMSKLKHGIQRDGLRLKFRTYEEIIRQVKLKAMKQLSAFDEEETGKGQNRADEYPLRIQLKPHGPVMIFILSRLDLRNAPYQIRNQSIHHTLCYRQRGIDGLKWRILKPGTERYYVLDDPTKQPHNLQLHLRADEDLRGKRVKESPSTASATSADFGDGEQRAREGEAHAGPSKASWFSSVRSERKGDRVGPTATLSIAKVGAREDVLCPERVTRKGDGHCLLAEIQAEGHQRVLTVKPYGNTVDQHKALKESLRDIENKHMTMAGIRDRYSDLLFDVEERKSEEATEMMEVKSSKRGRTASHSSIPQELQDEYERLMYAEHDEVDEVRITKPHQLAIQVIEASDVRAADLNGFSDPYVTVHLKTPRRKGLVHDKWAQKASTYYCERTLNPTWVDQYFIFDVPENAACAKEEDVDHDYLLRIQVFDRDVLRQDDFLGQVDLRLKSLHDQQEVLEWYPLQARSRNRFINLSSDEKVSGQIKLRCQWIHSFETLLRYRVDLCEDRLSQLNERLEGRRRAVERIKLAELEAKKAGEKENARQNRKKSSIRAQARLMKRRAQSRATKTVDGARQFTHSVADQMKGRVDLVKEKAKQAQEHGKKNIHGAFKKIIANSSGVFEDGMQDDMAPQEQRRKSRLRGLTLARLKHDLANFSAGSPSQEPDAFANFSAGALPAGEPEPLKLPESAVSKRASPPPGGALEQKGAGGAAEKLRPAALRRSASARRAPNGAAKERGVQLLFGSFRNSLGRLSSGKMDEGPAEEKRITGKDRWRRLSQHVADSNFSTLSAVRRTEQSEHDAPDDLSSRHRRSVSRDSYMPVEVAKLGHRRGLSEGGLASFSLADATAALMERAYGVIAERRRLVEERHPARASFLHEARRAHRVVNTTGGTLIINPIQAAHLTETRRAVYVCANVGSAPGLKTKGSFKGVVKPLWKLNEGMKLTIGQDLAETEDGIGTIDAMVYITVRVENDIFSDPEIGRVVLPVRDIIGKCRDEDGCCTAWFPLAHPSEMQGRDGGGGYSWRALESERLANPENVIRASLQLVFHWVPSADMSMLATKRYALFSLRGVSAGIIDSAAQEELLNLSINDIEARVSEKPGESKVSASIGWLQIDHQQGDGSSKVVLAPKPDFYEQAAISIGLRRGIKKKASPTALEDDSEEDGVVHVEYCGLKVRELDLRIEQSILLRLADFISSVVSQRQMNGEDTMTQVDSLLAEEHNLFRPTPADEAAEAASDSEDEAPEERSSIHNVVETTLEQTKKVFIEKFVIFPVRLNVSFIHTPNLDSAKDDQTPVEGSNRVVGVLVGFVLDITSSITDAPLVLAAVKVTHQFEAPDKLVSQLQKLYRDAALTQLYKILGSLDFMGNPLGLIKDVKSGVVDFFYEPGKGITQKSATNFGRGVVKGTLSLVSNTTSAAFAAVNRMTGTVGKGMASLTFDHGFMERRYMINSQERLLYLRPVQDLVAGVLYGVVGIVGEPVRGLRRKGLRGLALGACFGFVGVFVKPAVGVLDAATHTTDLFRRGAQYLSMSRSLPVVQRVRLQQVFGEDGRLMHYTKSIALAAWFLRKLPIRHGTGIAGGVLDHIVGDIHIGLNEYRAAQESLLGKEYPILCVLLRKRPGWDSYLVLSTIRVLKVNVFKAIQHEPIKSWEVILDTTSDDAAERRASNPEVFWRDEGETCSIVVAKRADGDPLGKWASPFAHFGGHHPSAPPPQPKSRMGPAEDWDEDPDLELISSSHHTSWLHRRSRAQVRRDRLRAAHGEHSRREDAEPEYRTISGDYTERASLLEAFNALACLTGYLEKVVHDPRLGGWQHQMKVINGYEFHPHGVETERRLDDAAFKELLESGVEAVAGQEWLEGPNALAADPGPGWLRGAQASFVRSANLLIPAELYASRSSDPERLKRAREDLLNGVISVSEMRDLMHDLAGHQTLVEELPKYRAPLPTTASRAARTQLLVSRDSMMEGEDAAETDADAPEAPERNAWRMLSGAAERTKALFGACVDFWACSAMSYEVGAEPKGETGSEEGEKDGERAVDATDGPEVEGIGRKFEKEGIGKKEKGGGEREESRGKGAGEAKERDMGPRTEPKAPALTAIDRGSSAPRSPLDSAAKAPEPPAPRGILRRSSFGAEKKSEEDDDFQDAVFELEAEDEEEEKAEEAPTPMSLPLRIGREDLERAEEILRDVLQRAHREKKAPAEYAAAPSEAVAPLFGWREASLEARDAPAEAEDAPAEVATAPAKSSGASAETEEEPIEGSDVSTEGESASEAEAPPVEGAEPPAEEAAEKPEAPEPLGEPDAFRPIDPPQQPLTPARPHTPEWPQHMFEEEKSAAVGVAALEEAEKAEEEAPQIPAEGAGSAEEAEEAEEPVAAQGKEGGAARENESEAIEAVPEAPHAPVERWDTAAEFEDAAEGLGADDAPAEGGGEAAAKGGGEPPRPRAQRRVSWSDGA